MFVVWIMYMLGERVHRNEQKNEDKKRVIGGVCERRTRLKELCSPPHPKEKTTKKYKITIKG